MTCTHSAQRSLVVLLARMRMCGAWTQAFGMNTSWSCRGTHKTLLPYLNSISRVALRGSILAIFSPLYPIGTEKSWAKCDLKCMETVELSVCMLEKQKPQIKPLRNLRCSFIWRQQAQVQTVLLKFVEAEGVARPKCPPSGNDSPRQVIEVETVASGKS